MSTDHVLLLLTAIVIIHLSEWPRGDDVVHPLYAESAAQLDGLHVALPGACKRGEQETHGQRVVYVPQSVDERRVPVRISLRYASARKIHECESCKRCDARAPPSADGGRYCTLPHLSFTTWSSL